MFDGAVVVRELNYANVSGYQLVRSHTRTHTCMHIAQRLEPRRNTPFTRANTRARTPHPGNAVSAAMVTHWVCNVAIGQNFMAWVDKFGLSAVYAGFAVASLVGAAYIQANVPETKVGARAEAFGGGEADWEGLCGCAHE